MISSTCIITGVYIDELVTVHKICARPFVKRKMASSLIRSKLKYIPEIVLRRELYLK